VVDPQRRIRHHDPALRHLGHRRRSPRTGLVRRAAGIRLRGTRGGRPGRPAGGTRMRLGRRQGTERGKIGWHRAV
jgi:hypothetical protein